MAIGGNARCGPLRIAEKHAARDEVHHAPCLSHRDDRARARVLAGPGIAPTDHPGLAALAQAADPDLALAGLASVAERDKNLTRELEADAAFRARLIAVLGVSKALADHLVRHPADRAVLRGRDADTRPERATIRAEL